MRLTAVQCLQHGSLHLLHLVGFRSLGVPKNKAPHPKGHQCRLSLLLSGHPASQQPADLSCLQTRAQASGVQPLPAAWDSAGVSALLELPCLGEYEPDAEARGAHQAAGQQTGVCAGFWTQAAASACGVRQAGGGVSRAAACR